MAKPRTYETSVQFSALGRDWYADVEFSISGRYRRATLTEPEEYPSRDIEAVYLTGVAPERKESDCNEVFRERFAIDYTELPTSAQDAIEDAVRCYDDESEDTAALEEYRAMAMGVDP